MSDEQREAVERLVAAEARAEAAEAELAAEQSFYRHRLEEVEAKVRATLPARFDLVALELASAVFRLVLGAHRNPGSVQELADRALSPAPGDLVYANGRQSPDGIGILIGRKAGNEWDILNLATGAVDSWGNQDFYCVVPAERVKKEWLPSPRAALSPEGGEPETPTPQPKENDGQ